MSIPKSQVSSSPQRSQENTIEVNLQDLTPCWATEYPLHNPIRLVVHLQSRLPGIDAQSVIERAVHNYFAYRTELNGREFKWIGAHALVFGLWLMVLAFKVRRLRKEFSTPAAAHA